LLKEQKRRNDFMRILTIGDFHGKVPRNLKKFVKRNRIDLIVSQGDFSGGSFGKELLDYEEKICRKYGPIRKKWPKEIKKEADKKYKKWNKEAILNSEKVLNYLKKINIPLYFVHGNWDFFKKERKEFTNKKLGLDEIKSKNMFFIHRKSVKINGYTLLGFGGYRPSSLKKYLVYEFPEPRPTVKRILRLKAKLTRQMKKLFKGRTNIILITHDPPYDTKLDYLKNEKKHIGEIITTNVIKKYQPLFCVCGHMHENQGKAKIGKTIVVNPGYGRIGEASIIDLDKNDIKFVKI